jgi:D-alanyl-D-alanine carboxypeptidase
MKKLTKKIVFLLLILVIPLWWGISFSKKKVESFFYAQISQPLEKIESINIPLKQEKEQPELKVESAISVKVNKTGREKTLLTDNPKRAMPIASLTKLMTALIVLENTSLSEVTIISQAAASKNDVPVHGNLKGGEPLSVEQLLDLMLIYSSNDAAFALSEVIGEEEFIEKMNEKAKFLGLKDPYFSNSNGLDPKNPEEIHNYSTVRDLYALSRYIILKKGPYPTSNGVSNLFLPYNQKLIGGKTGYTKKAGGCMLAVFENEEENYFINIILGTDSSIDRIQEMQKIINWINS